MSADAKLHEDEYRLLLQQMNAELERARPNFKAVDQLSDVSELAQDVSREAAEAHRKIEKVRQKLEAVKKERRTVFLACFEQVSREVGDVYNRLTGGSVHLALEDLEEPFNAGINFTAMPPTKRYCEISVLSSGERALVSLALLFAVQAYQRPPFLVLDEVDAHLDA